MQKILLIAGVGILAGCGVPPEEDAATKSKFKPAERRALFLPVTQDDLAQSQAWADTVKRYR